MLPARLRFGRFDLIVAERRLLDDGRPVAIGARALDLLQALIERRDRVVTKAELLDLIWPGLVVEEANLPVQVSALRKVLGANVVTTIPGRGYQFSVALQELVDADSRTRQRETAFRDTVPSAPDDLIGRAADVDALPRLLGRHRLVTILGAGGIGKTRVAQRVATVSADDWPDGVLWIDLAAADSLEGVLRSIADAGRFQLRSGDALRQVQRVLSRRNLLLVLDNCEHLAAEVAGAAAQLLAATPGLRILATSQEPIQVDGECLYMLGSLAVPTPGLPLDAARGFAALQLFEGRAAAVDASFSLTEANVALAIDLCGQLDGIPLAIEMAASRLAVLGLADLHARLGERLGLLRASGRAMPRRHATLRAVLDWTYALLSPSGQAALRTLSTCAGTFTLDTAERLLVPVLAHSPDPCESIDALTALVERSLLHIVARDPRRYRLPATVKLHAEAALQAAGELEEAIARHGDAMAVAAVSALDDFWEAADAPWLARCEPLADDWRLASERACARRRAHIAAPLLDALSKFDDLRGEEGSVRGRAQAAWTLLADADGADAARLWNSIAGWETAPAVQLDRVEAGRRMVDAWDSQRHPRQALAALIRLGIIACACADLATAQATLARIEALRDARVGIRLQVLIMRTRAEIKRLQSDVPAALVLLEGAGTLARDAGLAMYAATIGALSADWALLGRDAASAIALGQRLVDRLRTMKLPSHLGRALGNLCCAHLLSGDLSAARAAVAEAFPLMWRGGLHGYLFDHLATIDSSCGRFDRAARFLGLSQAWYDDSLRQREPNEARIAGIARRLVEAAIGGDALQVFEREGRALSDEAATSLANAAMGERIG